MLGPEESSLAFWQRDLFRYIIYLACKCTPAWRRGSWSPPLFIANRWVLTLLRYIINSSSMLAHNRFLERGVVGVHPHPRWDYHTDQVGGAMPAELGAAQRQSQL